MLYYPIFMFESDATRFFIFIFGFDENQISRGSALAVLGSCSYIAGSLLVREKTETPLDCTTVNNDFKKVNTKYLFVVAVLSFILFRVLGGYQQLAATYNGEKFNEEGGIAGYFFIICPAFLISGLVLEFYNISNSNALGSIWRDFSVITVVSTLFIFLLMLIIGSRTLPLQIVLLVIGLYSAIFKNMTFPKFLLNLLAGVALMFTIVLMRGYNQESDFIFSDLVMDLVINNRSSYLALEIVDHDGLNFGKSMISPVAAPIPLLQNILINSGLKESDLSSSLFFTVYTFGEFDGFGLGSNIIADIYISWGTIGVILLMFILGFFVNKSRLNLTKNVYYLTAYAVLMSYSVYLVRAEYFVFLRYLIWCAIIVFFAKNKFIYQRVTFKESNQS